MNANIPFAFAVGDNILPSGEYEIRSALWYQNNTIQSIRRADGSHSAMVSTMTAEQKGQETKPRLIFTQYGHEYFLKQIWTAEGKGVAEIAP